MLAIQNYLWQYNQVEKIIYTYICTNNNDRQMKTFILVTLTTTADLKGFY